MLRRDVVALYSSWSIRSTLRQIECSIWSRGSSFSVFSNNSIHPFRSVLLRMEQIRKWRLDESEIWFDLGRISQKWDLWIDDSHLGIFYSIRKRIHSSTFIRNNSAMNLNYRVLFCKHLFSFEMLWPCEVMKKWRIYLDDPAITIIFRKDLISSLPFVTSTFSAWVQKEVKKVFVFKIVKINNFV